jgi:hypothetical protein
MTIQIKHAFTSAKGDGSDATLVRPSNWNAVHTTSMATGQLLGRLTTGAGSFEEIPVSAFIASILNTTDLATLVALVGGAETGDVKYTFKTSASSGWLLVAAAGSIGDATSGATLLASSTAAALYQVIYDGCSNALAPVAGGRGASAAADFAAHKAMTIPQLVGRSPIAAGAAAGVTTLKALGTLYGEENHALTSGENGTHTHANSLSDPTHLHSSVSFFQVGGGSVGGGGAFGGTLTANTSSNSTGVTITNASSGSGTAHNTIHPVVGLNAMVKL